MREAATQRDGATCRARTDDLRFTKPLAHLISGEVTEPCEGGGEGPSRFPSTPVQIDPDLTAVVDSWSRLPEAVRAGILAMVRASHGFTKG